MMAEPSDRVAPPERIPTEGRAGGLSYPEYADGKTVYLGNFETVRAYLRVRIPCQSKPSVHQATYNALGAWVTAALDADAQATRSAVLEGKVAPPDIPEPEFPAGVVASATGELEYTAGVTLSPAEGESRRIEGGLTVPVRATPAALRGAFLYVYDFTMRGLQARLDLEQHKK